MIGTDKSGISLTILIQHIQSSSDESEELFFAGESRFYSSELSLGKGVAENFV
jgi:hypothetical protein